MYVVMYRYQSYLQQQSFRALQQSRRIPSYASCTLLCAVKARFFNNGNRVRPSAADGNVSYTIIIITINQLLG